MVYTKWNRQTRPWNRGTYKFDGSNCPVIVSGLASGNVTVSGHCLLPCPPPCPLPRHGFTAICSGSPCCLRSRHGESHRAYFKSLASKHKLDIEHAGNDQSTQGNLCCSNHYHRHNCHWYVFFLSPFRWADLTDWCAPIDSRRPCIRCIHLSMLSTQQEE
jgi:hypothetical protein